MITQLGVIEKGPILLLQYRKNLYFDSEQKFLIHISEARMLFSSTLEKKIELGHKSILSKNCLEICVTLIYLSQNTFFKLI